MLRLCRQNSLYIMAGLNLISLNVRAIRDRVKRKTIFDWVRMKRGDVVMLQETYSTPDIEEEWKGIGEDR